MNLVKTQVLAVGRIGLGLMLASAAVLKGLDASEAVVFLRSVGIDEGAVRPIVMTTIVLEISIGLPFALGIELRYVAWLAALFFVLLACISIYAWQTGATASCGCFGGYLSSKADVWLVLRNAAALFICICVATQKEHRWALQNRIQFEQGEASDKA